MIGEPHHTKAIDDFLGIYQGRKEFTALLLAGSLAHGYAKASSDVDIVLVATEQEFARRKQEQKLAFSLWDIAAYEGGYIDCKVVSMASLTLIAEKGSDPARYAFKDARILRSEAPGLEDLLARVTRFPSEDGPARQHRFASQLLAWKWYLSQGEEKKSPYLIHLAAFKIALFAGRLVLNLNGQLYPYHKWLHEEVRRSPNQPPGLTVLLGQFLERPGFALAQQLSDLILGWLGLVEKEIDWPNQFMADSENNWLDHEPPIDDL